MVDGVNLFFFFIAVDRVLSYSDFERGFLLFEGVVKFKTRFFTYFRKNTCHLLRVTHRLRHNLPAPYAIPRVSPNIGAVILVVEREAVPQLALGHATGTVGCVPCSRVCADAHLFLQLPPGVIFVAFPVPDDAPCACRRAAGFYI